MKLGGLIALLLLIGLGIHAFVALILLLFVSAASHDSYEYTAIGAVDQPVCSELEGFLRIGDTDKSDFQRWSGGVLFVGCIAHWVYCSLGVLLIGCIAHRVGRSLDAIKAISR
jgi:hypothetical protein